MKQTYEEVRPSWDEEFVLREGDAPLLAIIIGERSESERHHWKACASAWAMDHREAYGYILVKREFADGWGQSLYEVGGGRTIRSVSARDVFPRFFAAQEKWRKNRA